jgi:hypothetical protein
MICHIDNQIAAHAYSDYQACAEMEYNETATADLFDKSQGEFSNGVISLLNVIKRAQLTEEQFTTDFLCELAIAKVNDIKKHRALHNTLVKTLSKVALEMNEEMASHRY